MAVFAGSVPGEAPGLATVLGQYPVDGVRIHLSPERDSPLRKFYVAYRSQPDAYSMSDALTKLPIRSNALRNR